MITGVYEGNTPSDFLAAQRWSGNEFTAVSVHTGGANWSDFVSSVSWEVNLWKNTAAQKLWSVPLLATGGDLHSAATGAYDQYYVAAAKALAASSTSGPIYVRTGWEFNGDWETWAATGKTSDYIGAYRDFVAAFRTVSDRFVFTWAPNVSGGGMNPATAYPGDDVVDIIGMDFYWKPQYDGTDPTKAWNTYVNEKYGLNWLETFAAQHGKPTAYPEWGIETDNASPYIALAAAWFKSHNVAYETYWDSNADYSGKISDNSKPTAGAAFINAFSLPNGEVDTVAADGSVIKHFPLDASQGFTAREDHYSASGVLTSRVFFNAAGAPIRSDTVKPDGSYVSHVVASASQPYSSSDTAFSSTGTVLSRVLYDASGHTIETDTYQANGAYVAHVTGITGQPYAAYDAVHAADGSTTSTTFYEADGSVWTPTVAPSTVPVSEPSTPSPEATDPTPAPAPATPVDSSPTPPSVVAPDASAGGSATVVAVVPVATPTTVSVATPVVDAPVTEPTESASSTPTSLPALASTSAPESPAAPVTVITGTSGADTIHLPQGSSTIDAGSGTDTVVVDAFSRGFVFTDPAAASITLTAPDGSQSVISNAETIQFLDGTYDFDLHGVGAEVYRLYDTYLGRTPDAAGFSNFVAYIQSGHTLADAAQLAAQSPEFLAHTGSLSNHDFVEYMYETTLHRSADDAGMAAYLKLLDGGASRASIALGMAESPEHVAVTSAAVNAGLWEANTNVEGLMLLYDTAVSRLPDSVGLAGYGAELAAGTTFKEIALEMSHSSEFQTAYGSLDDTHFIEALFQNTLGREADPGGLAAYTAELSSGYTRADILYQVSMSEEHQQHVLSHFNPLLLG